jgi:hypothetical protein
VVALANRALPPSGDGVESPVHAPHRAPCRCRSVSARAGELPAMSGKANTHTPHAATHAGSVSKG